jgi:hypothetical protein
VFSSPQSLIGRAENTPVLDGNLTSQGLSEVGRASGPESRHIHVIDW